MANVHSLRNQIVELQVNVNHMHQYRTASILAFTEMCLNKNDDGDTLYIDGFGILLKLDRDNELTGKQCCSGVCFHVNTSWCSTIVARDKLCTSDVELLAVS